MKEKDKNKKDKNKKEKKDKNKKDKKKSHIEALTQTFGEIDLSIFSQIANHTPMTREQYTMVFQQISTSVVQKSIENDEEVNWNKILTLLVKEFNKVYGETYGEQTGYNFLGKENIC